MRTWLASAAELDEAARLLTEFRDWFGNSVPSDAEMRSSVARIHAGDGEFLLGALDGEPVGVCQVRYRWSVWASAEDAWLEDVFVRESARGSGLGRALVQAAVERAREHGCRRIELDVDEANTPALELYGSLGFSGELKAQARSLLLGLRLR
jgi:GNAT superfamily N-acetyltransferase